MSRDSNFALVDVSTPLLQKLLSAVYRKTVECPLSPAGLAAIGLQHTSGPLLNHLRGLSASAVHAVLVAVLAERKQADARAEQEALRIGQLSQRPTSEVSIAIDDPQAISAPPRRGSGTASQRRTVELEAVTDPPSLEPDAAQHRRDQRRTVKLESVEDKS